MRRCESEGEEREEREVVLGGNDILILNREAPTWTIFTSSKRREVLFTIHIHIFSLSPPPFF